MTARKCCRSARFPTIRLYSALAVSTTISEFPGWPSARSRSMKPPMPSGSIAGWAPGIQAPAWLRDLDGLEVNRADQLVVATTLATTSDPDIFALGDCAACPWPEDGREGAILPPRAQVARQQATLLVKTIKAR